LDEHSRTIVFAGDLQLPEIRMEILKSEKDWIADNIKRHKDNIKHFEAILKELDEVGSEPLSACEKLHLMVLNVTEGSFKNESKKAVEAFNYENLSPGK
jgi:predicted DNA-binding protein YlxM (UPF0122 family)